MFSATDSEKARKAARKVPCDEKIGVCIVNENNPVPRDTRVWKEACALRDAGYQVSIVCPQGWPNCGSKSETIEGIEIFRHRAFASRGVSGYLREYVFSLIAEFYLTLKVYARRRFKVLQACNPPDTIFVIGLFFKLLGVRFVFDHHDLTPELFEAKFGKRRGVLYRLVRWAERLTFISADVCLATNESMRGVAIRRGKRHPDRVFLVRNYPDLSEIRQVKPEPVLKEGKAFLVAYLGIMSSQDGVGLLLDSINYIVHGQGRQDTHFVFIGDGDELPSLRARVRKRGLDPYVSFTGWLLRGDIDRYLSTADVAVSPDPYNSLNDASTMIKTLEYMAYGCPIVQFNLTEGRRSSGNASLYAQRNDPVDFAKQILQLLDSEALREQLGRIGRTRVEQQVNWASERASLLKAYETVLETGNGLPASAPTSGDTIERGRPINLLEYNGKDRKVFMNQPYKVIIDYLRCPDDSLQIKVAGDLSGDPGYFNFGSDLICYGKCSAFAPSRMFSRALRDAREYARVDQGVVSLPFNLSEVVETLRREDYVATLGQNTRHWTQRPLFRTGYYAARPVMPVSVRRPLQRLALRGWQNQPFPCWPVDTTVERLLESIVGLILQECEDSTLPFIWFWPEGKQACAVMTHDVETDAGRDFCESLMDVDESFGIKASFQVVPERRYEVPETYLTGIIQRGFEVNVQDLNHDGRLFDKYDEFQRRTKTINAYADLFKARGFRSAVLYRKVDWLNSLCFEYDMSVPNVAHLDPQRGGCCTIFPFFVGDILEIPVTMTQDYTLFHILRDYSLDLWREQAGRILERHGVMNFIVHPDYVTGGQEMRVFKDLLAYLSELRAKAGLWIPLPRELSEWWRQRSRMQVVRNGSGWKIVGEGKERARLAYARWENAKLVYDLKA